MDSRKLSSSYCSSVTIVVFVALCLVGIWMMTSWTVVPFGNVEMSPEETNSEVKKQVPVENEPQHVEDSFGGTAKNANYKTPQSDTSPEVNQNPDPSGKITQNRPEEITDKNPVKEDTKKKPNDTSGNGNKSDDKYKSEVNNELDNVYKTETEHTSKSETRNESDDTSKSENENDGSENTENDETKTEGGEVDTEGKESNTEGGETNENGEDDVQDKESQGEKNSESDESSGETTQDENVPGENKTDQTKNQVSNDVFPDPAQSELLNETNTQNGAFSTQAVESQNEKDAQWSSSSEDPAVNKVSAGKMWGTNGIKWKLCNVSAGADYIPCLDNEQAIKKLRSTKHYEHRERHCPEEGPTCLVPLPKGYRQPIKWPISRDKIWYSNVPHTKLAQLKGHQNWVKVTGEYLTFPGGGTQFKHGALHYIDFIQESLPDIAWGKQSRVVLDVGCGVASFGGYLFEKDVITMSFAPKDEHEAQVQFALERGIPAVSAVMGTKRLPFPSKVFDIVHCARCRVPWHIEGGMLLLELNRVLRPGGYFVWSATPVYKKLEEDVGIWNAMSLLTKSMCWDLVTKKKDPVNRIGVAIYKKPSSNDCYEKRMEIKPPLCEENDDPDAAWNVSLQACMHKVPVDVGERGSQWPEQWPKRLEKSPIWLNNSQVGVYGKVAPVDFKIDYEHWKHVVSNSYLNGMGVDWSRVRNVMDMRSIYGGFAAALRDLQVWVMNVVTVDSPDTLPIIYDRGLFGIYHDWCESFSTYPRTYDLLHADHLFSELKNRCKLVPVIAEVDRILRPEGKLIVRDNVETISEVENIARSLHWEIRLTYSNDREGLLCVQKSMWRPHETETSMS